MYSKHRLIYFNLLLLLCIALIPINAKGCPWRTKSKEKVGSSGYEWSGITAPSNLIARFVTLSQIELLWIDNSLNNNNFEIERKGGNSEDWTQITSVGADMTSYSDPGPFSIYTVYYYRVRASNIIGDRSAWSNEAMITTLPAIWFAVATGRTHSIALTSNGNIWTWGRNTNGQLGIGNTVNAIIPTQLGTETDWNAISGGGDNSAGLKTDGTLWSWGANGSGQLGMGDSLESREPFQVGTNTNWRTVVFGFGYCSGIKNDATLWAWGWNNRGQLGLGDTFDRYTPTQVETTSDWSAIALGGGGMSSVSSHTISIKTDGTMWSCGYNNYGQLGVGDINDRNTPSQIGNGTDWQAIAAGGNHSMALKSNSTIWTWGLNNYGQLGLGDTGINRNTPTQIGANSDWSFITSGYYHSILLKTNNTVWSCGGNNIGQLGLGDNVSRNTLTQIGIDSDWSQISASESHTIALKMNGTIWVWGGNNEGQLGLGDILNERNIPCPLGSPMFPGALVATATSSSQINLSWVDYPTSEDGFKIERKTGPSGVWTQIATVGTNVISYSDTGLTMPVGTTYYYRVKAFNIFGDSSYSNVASATTVLPAPLNLIVTVIAPTRIDLTWTDNSIDEDGFKIERKAKSIGTYEEIVPQGWISYNTTSYSDISSTGFAPNTMYYYRVRAYNTLGNGPYSNEAWTAVSGNWIDFTGGGYHSIGLKNDRTLWSWGFSFYGQLGLGNSGINATRITPTQIGTDSDWDIPTAGYSHSIVRTTNSILWAWGNNEVGQLGLGHTNNRITPIQIGAASNWAKVATGSYHALAIKTTGTLWAWGSNGAGQLGVGGTDDRYAPTIVVMGTDTDWSIICGGGSHSIALKNNSSLWAWGYNSMGQLGLGDNNDRDTPTQVGTDSDWFTIGAGGNYTLAIKTDLTLWSWGDNGEGQLGLGGGGYRFTPSQIGTDSNWSGITAGYGHTIARRINGTLWSWGENTYGQLGLGDSGYSTKRTTPTQIGSETDWATIAAGMSHSLARKNDNTMWAWGQNTYGQLGLGDTINRYVPVLVGE